LDYVVRIFKVLNIVTNILFTSFFVAGLLSREAARFTERFVLTIGVGDDFVMRLSVDSSEDLRTQILEVLGACRLPKVT